MNGRHQIDPGMLEQLERAALAGQANPALAPQILRNIAPLLSQMRMRIEHGGPGFYGPGATAIPGHIPPFSGTQLDQVHPPDPQNVLQPLMAPDRWLVVKNIPALAQGEDSPGEQLHFHSGGGWLIGFRGSVIDETPGAINAGRLEQTSIGVRLTMNDGENIITNGETADFARYSDLFGDAVQWSPIMRRVDTKDVMNIQFRNFQPVGGEARPLRPSLCFAFWRLKYPGTD